MSNIRAGAVVAGDKTYNMPPGSVIETEGGRERERWKREGIIVTFVYSSRCAMVQCWCSRSCAIGVIVRYPL